MTTTESRKHTVLVLGCGSVGKRHARNLAEMGCGIVGFDPRQDRLDETRDIPGVIAVTDSIQQALNTDHLAGVVVCSPPAFHVEQVLAAVEKGLPVLLEKPVSPTLADAQKLDARLGKGVGKILLGYTYRWWQPVLALREKLNQGVIGTPLHARFTMSAHLADWHPWERYQDFFMASSKLGGGALLDESHFIDLALWFFGRPETVTADIAHLSPLEIDTDDNVDLSLRYTSGLRVVIHLDIFGRPHEKRVDIVGTEGTTTWLDADNCIVTNHGCKNEAHPEVFTCERNDMFIGVAREFLNMLDNGAFPRCCLQDGKAVLEVIEAARKSSAGGKTVILG